VDAAEEPQRHVPAELLDELVDERLGGAAPGEMRVERRAGGLELVRLAAEDAGAAGGARASSAALACAAILPKASGSLTARSASTLRSSGISALRRPETNWLYESPSRRAAALMRMIQSRRKVRFLFLRSR
jgi:hypothetical protein